VHVDSIFDLFYLFLFSRELWINFFKDAQETTTKLASFLQTTENQLGSNELSPMMKTLGEAKNSLYRKLKDYESIFDYYLTSTKSFASQSAGKHNNNTDDLITQALLDTIRFEFV
jgi:hypothetical protein